MAAKIPQWRAAVDPDVLREYDAFGPWIGWMAGWGLVSATILVLSNLAGIAVEQACMEVIDLRGSVHLGRQG